MSFNTTAGNSSLNYGGHPGSNLTYYVGGDYSPTLGLWDYWHQHYYPSVIKESYPVYIQERAMDKGQKSFEILKILMDKKIIKMDKVSDFVEAMDALIKVL